MAEQVCVVNIGARGRRRRAVTGGLFFAVAAAGAAILFVVDAPRIGRLGLFVPLWVGGIGVFQARAKT